MKKYIIYLSLFLTPLFIRAQEQTSENPNRLRFDGLNELLFYAEQNSSVIKTNDQQLLIAKYQRMEAIAKLVNFRNDNSFTMTDNTALATQYVPADLLGGEAGTFKPITLGQQYVSSLAVTAQIDIINPSSWAQLKKSGLNRQAAEINNLLSKKSFCESVAACYFNIVSLQEQIAVVQENIAASDTLCAIVNDKFSQNIVNKQDVNSAATNRLLLVDRLNQCKASLEKQYSSLKVLCDIPQETKLYIAENPGNISLLAENPTSTSQLMLQSAQLESDILNADLKSDRMSYLPVVSAFASWSDNQNSNHRFFDQNQGISKWVTANYIGLKLSFSIPDAGRIAETRKAKANCEISRINATHAQSENEQENRQMAIDYRSAYEQYLNRQQICALLEENYKLDKNRYDEEIISLEDLLKSFDKMLSARLDCINSVSNLSYTKSKIEINNQVK